jgi:hypothetical protein
VWGLGKGCVKDVCTHTCVCACASKIFFHSVKMTLCVCKMGMTSGHKNVVTRPYLLYL